MAEPNVVAMSRLFTGLVNTKVDFAPARNTVPSTEKQMLGVYTVLPEGKALVVSADQRLLASLAGALCGLPDTAVAEHLKTTPLDELLRDAIHEILNVASTIVTSKGRAVFTQMASQAVDVSGEAAQLLKKAPYRYNFDTSVANYRGGKFSVFAASLQ